MRNARPASTPFVAWPLAALTGTAALAFASPAAAQADLTLPLPNVLLLIDTSGSMEYMPDGTAPLLDAQLKCQPPAPGKSNLNRWATLVSVLTGTVENYSCYAQPRTTGSSFQTEYTFNSELPYDLDYHLPFHRILSNDCTPAPGTMGAMWPGWPLNAITYHRSTDPNASCNNFKQTADGLLDTFADRARFGLMTFDSKPDPGTGAAGNAVNAMSGVKGLWSYYIDWAASGSASNGYPPNCKSASQTDSDYPYEVGARNPSAPPWEGRLMSFGDPNADAVTLQANNQHVQLALLAMRPYGATPLAGMLSDARDFIYKDTTDDPADGKPFGPAKDGFFTGGCRKTFVIVLSDGEPNMDLRKEGCGTGNGKCPYDLPPVIAADMASNGDPDTRVETFAVGFGLSSAAGIDCNALTDADFTGGGQCVAPANSALAACCNLAQIAIEGKTGRAYFADDIGGLKSALSLVLGQITSGAKTRTMPAFSSTAAAVGAQGNAEAVGYRFGAQFDTPSNSPLWVGRLVRERYKCVAQGGGQPKSEPQEVEGNKGDNFARNVNSNDAAHPRKFFTVVGATSSGAIYSARSIRPKLVLANADDGMGLYDGTTTGSGAPKAGPTFASEVKLSPLALGINPVTPPNQCVTQLGTASGATCTERLVRWEVGEVDAPLPTRDVTGCQVTDPISGQKMGCELGSIYHSTPVVAGPPNEFLRDESYDQFAVAQAGRPTALYVATTDGQLHAFKVSANNPNDTQKVDKLENNELWSFLPPAVLPRLLTSYNQQAILLDGQVVVKDIVLERTNAQAIVGSGAGGPQWRTILVAGGGGGGGYYFALDVTDPTTPEFLWQISQDFEGAEMFGPAVPTPAIATLSLSENSGPPKDVAVAILAGGGDPVLGGTCARLVQPPYAKIDGASPRAATRCWAAGAGTSLSIVRLSTGEVIRTFVSTKGVVSPNLLPERKTPAPFDSPLTGVPVPYPAKAGQVANRVYVGDADGTLWRIDLTKPDPNLWTVDMMWDGYESEGAAEGQPIATPPIVSIDKFGQPIVLFSTGDQDQITSLSPNTHMWSILETPNNGSFKATANFQIDMKNGERVTGPISLFASTAYFSSFKPEPPAAAGDVCTFGEGKLWGVDYQSGDGRLDPLDPTLKAQSQGKNSIVFGVAVTQTPSCADSTTFDSPYFGTYQGLSGGTPGEFQLVYQVSGKQAQPPAGDSGVFVSTVLPSPRVTTRIDSWAAIVE
jgi:type IV pilus assembly protein PilY1